MVGEFYAPAEESGLRYDDPRLALKWPLPVSVISPKDRAFKFLDEFESQLRSRMAARS
jgi:dTDP-4-dehydrorhamnose 3,5-epimerase